MVGGGDTALDVMSEAKYNNEISCSVLTIALPRGDLDLPFPGLKVRYMKRLLVALALILVASVVASLYPALRASRTPATELSRENL